MNHGSAHRVTQTYVKKDFSPAWELNDKVVEFIFFSDNPGKEELRRGEKKLETDRISKNNLLRGTAFTFKILFFSFSLQKSNIF